MFLWIRGSSPRMTSVGPDDSVAREYLDKLQTLLEPLARSLPAGVELVCKHFFSGAAAYANGRICITLTPVGLAMKLPEEARSELMAAGATPLRYFPNGPIKKDYVVVSQALSANGEGLERWVRKSIDYVLTLPSSYNHRRTRAL